MPDPSPPGSTPPGPAHPAPGPAGPAHPAPGPPVLPPLPPLPARLTDPVPVVVVGSAVWAGLAVVLGVLWLVGEGPPGVWFFSGLVGVGLGAIGLVVLGAQRRAARRGDKGAQLGT